MYRKVGVLMIRYTIRICRVLVVFLHGIIYVWIVMTGLIKVTGGKREALQHVARAPVQLHMPHFQDMTNRLHKIHNIRISFVTELFINIHVPRFEQATNQTSVYMSLVPLKIYHPEKTVPGVQSASAFRLDKLSTQYIKCLYMNMFTTIDIQRPSTFQDRCMPETTNHTLRVQHLSPSLSI